MTVIIAWFAIGVVSTTLCYRAFRLSFRDPITLGTIIFFTFGIALPPAAIFFGIIFFLCWAFEDADQRYTPVKWPIWWGRIRYRQHRICRYIWYLGRPPKEENILSGWRNAPKEYLR